MGGHSSIHFGSKKYAVFICWSKLNKVGVKVHRFSWPSGLNHCFFASHNADGVSSNPSSVNHILPLYSLFENNFNTFIVVFNRKTM